MDPGYVLSSVLVCKPIIDTSVLTVSPSYRLRKRFLSSVLVCKPTVDTSVLMSSLVDICTHCVLRALVNKWPP